MGAEGAGLDLGERLWAFRPPEGTGAESRERLPAASPPQARLSPRQALSIPPRPRARFSALALPGAGSSEACPRPSGCGSPAGLRVPQRRLAAPLPPPRSSLRRPLEELG